MPEFLTMIIVGWALPEVNYKLEREVVKGSAHHQPLWWALPSAFLQKDKA